MTPRLWAVLLASMAALVAYVMLRTGLCTVGVDGIYLRVQTGDYFWRFGPIAGLIICWLGAALLLGALLYPAHPTTGRPRPLPFAAAFVGLAAICLSVAEQLSPLEPLNPWSRWMYSLPALMAAYLAARYEYATGGVTRAGDGMVAALGGRRGPPLFFLLGIATASLVASRLYAWHPSVVDSHSQVLQARHLLQGILTLPLSSELRAVINLPNYTPSVPTYSQYPPGHILLLMPVLALGLPANGLNVLAGAVTVAVASALARRLHGPAAAVAAGLLLVFSPWWGAVSGGAMNHATTALALALVPLMLLHPTHSTPRHLVLRGAIAGLALGWAFATRPLTGAAHVATWGLVAALALLHANQRRHVSTTLAATALPFALVVAAVGFYNWKTTGSPTTFGYSTSFPELNRIGFRDDPTYHYTPITAIHRTVTNLFSLNQVLFGWAIGSAVLLAAWFLQGPKRRSEHVLILLFLAQCGAYTIYHFHQLFLGPRFWYEAAPCLAVLGGLTIARALDRFDPQRRGLLWLAVVCLGVGGYAWGFRHWGDVFGPNINRHVLAAIKPHATYQRPTAILVPKPFLDRGGMFVWGGSARRPPLYFIDAELESQARALPELKGFEWIAIETEKPRVPTVIMDRN